MDLEEKLNNKILEILAWLPSNQILQSISLAQPLFNQLGKSSICINGHNVSIFVYDKLPINPLHVQFDGTFALKDLNQGILTGHPFSTPIGFIL